MFEAEIIRNIKHPAFLIDQDWKFISSNPAARAWLKIPDGKNEIEWDKGLGISLRSVLHLAWNSEQPQEDILVGNTDGDLRPLYFSVVPTTHESRIYLFCQAFLINNNIMSKLKLEHELASERVELALRARRVGFWDWNVKDDVLFWDKTQYEIFGISPADFTNAFEAWASTLNPETAEISRREVQDALQGKSDYNTEFDIKTKSDEVRTIRASGILIKDNEGRPSRLVGLNWDVTYRRQMEKQFLEQAFLNRKITDTVPSFIIVANLRTRTFDFFNSQLMKMTGFTDDELHRLNFDGIASLVVTEDRAKYSEFLSRLPSLQDTEVTEAEFWFEGSSKGRRCLRIRAQIFERDKFGVPDSMIISGNDITEEKRILSEAESDRAKAFNAAKMAALGEMAGGIAHEINNPLTVIVGKAEILRKNLSAESFANPKVSESIDRIISTCQRIAKIIRGMRTISRSEDNEQFQSVMLPSVIDELIIICSQRMANQHIEFRVGRIPETIVDLRPVQISQILLNLLNNAIDAVIPFEKRWIAMDFKESKDEVRFVVTDCGGPIPSETAARMMQPFFTTKDIGKGTGLGLSISSSLAQQHGGSLAYDASHSNTRFILTLPKSQAKKFGSRS